MTAGIAKATALSLSSFCKRYTSSYETSSSSSSLTLSVWKRYIGTSELILDTNSEGDDLGEEDIEKDEEDKSSDIDDEKERIRGLEDEGLGLEGEEAAPEGQQQAILIGGTTVSEPLDPEDDRVYNDIPAYAPPAVPVQTLPSLEWLFGSLPVSPSSLIVLSPIASPVATPTATISVDEDQFIEISIGMSLEREQERATVTFGALWRPVLALEAWAGRADTRLADMSRDRYGDYRLIHDMLVQQTAMLRELQEMRGRVTTLEQERDRREQ
ncbi:hypothetical protein Tco_0374554 [Tanacetum coccineum]